MIAGWLIVVLFVGGWLAALATIWAGFVGLIRRSGR